MSWFSVVALVARGNRKALEDSVVHVTDGNVSSWEENFSSTLIFSHLSIGLQGPWIFSRRDSNNLATENRIFFFFHRDDTAHLVIVATLSPPAIPLHCVLMPLALREPLSIVRKYKRRSLEVQISVVLSGFFDQHRGCLKSETFPRRMCCGTRECWDPKKSLKKTHLPAG